MDFTGERFIPGTGGWQMAYEHYHRYLFAGLFAQGKSVLDVASGEGYGAAYLAKFAQTVWAADINAAAVESARTSHPAPNLTFFQADASCLPLTSGTVDLAVAFEVLEHTARQPEMIAEISRVLTPGGIAIISTPDRAVYSDYRGYSNPFHVRELYRGEFLELLGRSFASVQLMNQQVRAGSLISSEVSLETHGNLIIQPPPARGDEFAKPMYFIALCSKHADSAPRAPGCAYMDPSDALLEEWDERARNANAELDSLNREIQSLGRWGRSLEGVIAQKDEHLRLWGEQANREFAIREDNFNQMKLLMEKELEQREETIRQMQEQMADVILQRDEGFKKMREELAARDGTIQRLAGDLERETRHRDRVIEGYQEAYGRLEKEFEERSAWALRLKSDVESRDTRIREAVELLDRTDAELKSVESHLTRIRHAFLYRILCRLGLLPR